MTQNLGHGRHWLIQRLQSVVWVTCQGHTKTAIAVSHATIAAAGLASRPLAAVLLGGHMGEIGAIGDYRVTLAPKTRDMLWAAMKNPTACQLRQMAIPECRAMIRHAGK